MLRCNTSGLTPPARQVAFDPHHRFAGESFRHQRVDDGRSRVGLAGQFAPFDRFAALPKVFQNLRLLGCQSRQRVGQLRNRLDHDRFADAGLVANARRQDRLQHLAPAAQVIIGEPAGQAEQIGTEERLGVRHGGDRLDGTGRSVRAETDAITDGCPVASAKWGRDPLADGDGFAQMFGNGVRIRMVERPIEDDFDV